MVLFLGESLIVTRFRLLFVCREIFSLAGSLLREHFSVLLMKPALVRLLYFSPALAISFFNRSHCSTSTTE